MFFATCVFLCDGSRHHILDHHQSDSLVMMVIDDGAVLVAPPDSQRKPSRLSPLSRRLGSLRRN
jgi:hypothetical protein